MSNMRVLSTPVGAGQGHGSLDCVCHPILQTPFRGACACVANTTRQLTICIPSVPLMAHTAPSLLREGLPYSESRPSFLAAVGRRTARFSSRLVGHVQRSIVSNLV